MELELGVKITKVRDDIVSADLRIAKDRAGPLFLSSETESRFILTAHLKGFQRKQIKIEINEDGTRIAIKGEKPIQEMVMVGWIMYKKEVEMMGFKKIFRIPDMVVLDKIKAKFDEEAAVLTIVMPKSVRGVHGVGIEEVKDEEAASQTTHNLADEMANEQEPKEAVCKDIQEIDQVAQKLPENVPPEEIQETTSEEVVEHAPTMAPYPEAEIVEPKEVREIVEETVVEPEKAELPPPENTQPHSEEVVKKEEIPEAESQKQEQGLQESVASSPGTIESTTASVNDQGLHQQPELSNEISTQKSQVEEELTGKIEMPQQESKEGETESDIQKLIELKPDQQLEQTETPHMNHPAVEENRDKEVYKQEGSHEIEEETTVEQVELPKEKEGDGHGYSLEAAKQENPIDQPAGESKKARSNKSKLFAPCFFVGSAFLVSLMALVIHLIRSKKKK